MHHHLPTQLEQPSNIDNNCTSEGSVRKIHTLSKIFKHRNKELHNQLLSGEVPNVDAFVTVFRRVAFDAVDLVRFGKLLILE